jgi:hypothetical protein
MGLDCFVRSGLWGRDFSSWIQTIRGSLLGKQRYQMQYPTIPNRNALLLGNTDTRQSTSRVHKGILVLGSNARSKCLRLHPSSGIWNSHKRVRQCVLITIQESGIRDSGLRWNPDADACQIRFRNQFWSVPDVFPTWLSSQASHCSNHKRHWCKIQ